MRLPTPAAIVGHTSRRKTRFHTEQGEFVGLRGLAEYPRLLVERLRGSGPGPWMTPGAVARLDELISPRTRILEFGSGQSTVWYAARAGQVISLEHDPVWAAKVQQQLRATGTDNCELRAVPLTGLVEHVSELPDSSFDLVVVDNHETAGVTRLDCVRAARTKVRPGGALVVDDADRRENAGAYELLADWDARKFVGAKAVPLRATATAFFSRPS